eukprot:comp20353_c0_seq1/m.25686 comp20353_c0_seq1/g.25686  ORF comp20353_c0_seq1/g.25686 comp20353_c0_seq1/m.25686 type:complete len:103 (+) comp20353_c0_seq1:1364-1672(+)
MPLRMKYEYDFWKISMQDTYVITPAVNANDAAKNLSEPTAFSSLVLKIMAPPKRVAAPEPIVSAKASATSGPVCTILDLKSRKELRWVVAMEKSQTRDGLKT